MNNSQPGGLLHALAQRALGLETPLRSQRALRREGVAPGQLQAQASDLHLEPPLSRAHEPAAAMHTPPATLAPPPVAAAAAPALPLRAQQAASSAADAVSPMPQRRDSDTATSTPLLPPAAAADASTAQRTPTLPTPAAPPTLPATPALLLPRSTALPVATTAPHIAATARSRREARERSAAAAPTEVHVSIGRVELTALAQAAAPRTTPRRDASAGRSLADYLRGSKRPP